MEILREIAVTTVKINLIFFLSFLFFLFSLRNVSGLGAASANNTNKKLRGRFSGQMDLASFL